MTIAMIAYSCRSTSLLLVNGGNISAMLPWEFRGSVPVWGPRTFRISAVVAFSDVYSGPSAFCRARDGRILEEDLEAGGVLLAAAARELLFAVEGAFVAGCRCGGRGGIVVMAAYAGHSFSFVFYLLHLHNFFLLSLILQLSQL